MATLLRSIRRGPTAPEESSFCDGAVGLEDNPTEIFLIDNQDKLLVSMGLNTAVAAFVRGMEEGSVVDELKGCAKRVMGDVGYGATEGTKIKSAEQFSDSVLNLIITKSRWRSARAGSIIGDLSFLGNLITAMPSDVSAKAINYMSQKTRKTVIKEASNLLIAMTQANEAGDTVVSAATSSLLTDPSKAESLLRETQGELAQDELLQELVTLFRVDWRRPVPAESILRAHVSGEYIDEEQHVAAFAGRVAEAQATDDRYAIIRELAELALRFGSYSTNDVSVKNFLRINTANWKQNHQVKDSFDGFVRGEIAGVQAAIEGIVGTGKPDGFRGYVTEEDVERAIARADIFQPLPPRSQRTRDQRRPVAKQAIKEDGLISDRLRPVEVARKPNKLAILRNGQIITFETPHDAAVYFAGRDGERSAVYAGDVYAMTSHLSERETFIGTGISKLQAKKITCEGKPIALRRLAPDKTPGLRLTDPYMRAVFAVYDGTTVIIDSITTHEDFNKKYSN